MEPRITRVTRMVDKVAQPSGCRPERSEPLMARISRMNGRREEDFVICQDVTRMALR